MTSGRIRRAVAVAFVVVLGAATAAGCGSGNTSSDAASVTFNDGTVEHISKTELLNDVKDLQNSKAFTAFLKSQNASGLVSTQPGTATSALTATWLDQLINQAVVQHQFKKQGLQVTSSDTAAANANLTQLFSDAAYKAFPKGFQNTLLTAYSQRSAVLSSCPSNRVVYHILLKTEDEANAVLEKLAQGGDFSKLAQQYSIDAGSKSTGGLLGCLYEGEFPGDLQAAAELDQPDHVTVPVQVPLSSQPTPAWSLVLVRQWNPADAAADQTLAQSAQQAANCTVVLALNSVHVKVNPQFGSWQQAPQTPCSQNQQVSQVAPPQAPSPRSQREKPPTTTTPTT